MKYLDIYRKLSEHNSMSLFSLLKMTYSVAKCSEDIRSEILQYIDEGINPNYSMTLEFIDPKTKTIKKSTISSRMIEEKLHLDPFPALLYMDWIRREPRRAALFTGRIDSVILPDRNELRSQIDPEILKAADKLQREQEHDMKNMLNAEI